jgi:hypothetical protein
MYINQQNGFPRSRYGASSLTESPSKNLTASSFNKIMGSKSMPSISDIESSSMRLAKAASERDIEEKKSLADIEAKNMGYIDLSDMQRNMMNKRLGMEREEKIRNISRSRNTSNMIG